MTGLKPVTPNGDDNKTDKTNGQMEMGKTRTKRMSN